MDLVPSIIIKPGVVAPGEHFVAKFEVVILSRCLVHCIMLCKAQGRRHIQVAFEPDKIPQRCHCIIQNHIHPPGVHFGNTFAPDIDRAKMRIQEREIQGTKAIGSPREIDHWTAGKIYPLDSHAC